MDEILKKLLNNEVLNEETKKAVREAFKKSLDEAKAEQEKALRAEMAERYERDKRAIHKALEQFLTEGLEKHVAEFRSGVEEVNALKKQYADKIVAVKEVAKKYVQKRIGAAEQAIEGVLRKELTELHKDEKRNRRAYLNAITEAKAEQEAAYEAFRFKAAKVLEHVINVKVQGKLDMLESDIRAAREADFGREIYEAFQARFRRQFFNSSGEFKKLTTAVQEAQAERDTIKKVATQKVKEARQRAVTAEASSKHIQESMVRAKTIAKMLKPFTGKAREKMRHLLEVTKTPDLKKTYKKFAAEIINESKPSRPTRRNKIDEAVVTLKTGGAGTAPLVEVDDEFESEIDEIVKLAGVGKQG
jgi:hypothetical protein